MQIILEGQIHWKIAEALEDNGHSIHYAGNSAGDITHTYIVLN